MPLSPGHLLVTTRRHHEKISDVTDEEAQDLGRWLTRLSRVLAKATGVWDWNIVQNNGRNISVDILESVGWSC
jgi:diadenosine tetraphosphate (Ap4A) HIT family hydrolase